MSNETWYPLATRLPITTTEFWKPRPRTLLSICNHITDAYDSRGDLQNSNNSASVNFLVRDEPGGTVVYQFMPVEWAAYGNGIWSEDNPYMPAWIKALLPGCRNETDNINFYTVSIEHERKYPFTTLPSEEMTVASINLQRWLADTFPTIIKDRDHIIGHYQVDNVRRANCPGGPAGKLFPFDRILTALTNPKVPAGARYFPETKHYLEFGFKDKWEEYEKLGKSLEVIGYPIEEPVQETIGSFTGTVQYFQKGRMEYHPELPGSPTLFGNVGAQLLGLS